MRILKAKYGNKYKDYIEEDSETESSLDKKQKTLRSTERKT